MSALINAVAVKINLALNDRRGVTSLEYGVVAAALIAAVTAGMAVLSTDLSAAFTSLGNAIKSAF